MTKATLCGFCLGEISRDGHYCQGLSEAIADVRKGIRANDEERRALATNLALLMRRQLGRGYSFQNAHEPT